MSDGLIDLGDRTAPALAGRGRRPTVLSRPRALVLAVCGLALMAIAGSAPGPPDFGPRWTAAGGEFLVVGDFVYVWSVTAGVVAHARADGAIAWQRPDLRAEVVDEVGGGVLSAFSGISSGVARTLLIDGRTGVDLAAVTGYPIGHADGGILPIVLASPGRECPDPADCYVLAGVDPRTGDDSWRTEPYPSSRLLLGEWRPEPPHLFGTIAVGGRLALRAFSTGAVVAEYDLPPAAVAPEPTQRGRLALIGDAVYWLTQSPRPSGQPGTATVVRFDPTGARGWTATTQLHVANEPEQPITIEACGIRLCLTDGGGVAIIDPGSGRVDLRFDGRLMQVVSATRLLIWPTGRPDEPAKAIALLDLRTGHRQPFDDRTQLIAMADRRAVVITGAGQRSTVAVDSASGTRRGLGWIPAPQRCVVADDDLVCSYVDITLGPPGTPVRTSQALGVWPLTQP